MSKLKLFFTSLVILASVCIMAGEKNSNFRLGIAYGEKSIWASDLKKVIVKENKGRLTYTLTDPLLGKGFVSVHIANLSDTNGFLLEVEGKNLPEGLQLIWSFGGCYGKVLDHITDGNIEPAHCKYNVFSVEGTAFSVYYGESMKLRVVQGITPSNSDIRLSDAHKQQTPLELFESGKKTDAPVLAASTPLNEGEKLYFCFYYRNKKADYNYYMLSDGKVPLK